MNVTQDVRRMWGNGSRGLLIALIALIASAVFFAAISILAFAVLRSDTYAPIQNQNPQHVENPITKQGGTVTVTAKKCVNSDRAIGIDSQSYWQNLDDRTIRVLRTDTRGITREPGCLTVTFANPIPADLPSGHYRIEASEVTRSDHGETQVANWFTDPFEVQAK